MTSHLLIAEDTAVVARSLEMFFGRHLKVDTAPSVTDAQRLLDDGTRWSGAIFDVGLPDGSGLDLLAAFRKIEPDAPVLVLTGLCDAELINTAQRRSAEYAVKPVRPANLRAFLGQVLAYDAARARDIEVIVMDLGDRHDLTLGERKILALSARGTARKDLAAELHVTENTIKAQMRSLLRKCGDAEGIGDLVRMVWRRSSR